MPADTDSALVCQRSEFLLPAGSHYLNCAYMAPLSHAVERAAHDALRAQYLPSMLPPEAYFDIPARLRARFAQLVHVEDASRVALLPSVSYAMATAARNVPIATGQTVVVIGEEFPSAVLPWRRLARERGAALKTVLAPDRTPETTGRRGALWTERLIDAIDTRTAVVVVAPVHWSDGTRFDLSRIAARARDVGAIVIVDGTQSVGALPFDVREVQPDMLVVAGYKWLMGGYGLSLAYFGPRFDGGVPLEDVWTSQVGSDDFARLAEYRDAYRDTAERYDGGQRASFVLAPMLTASIEQLLSWNVSRIQRYCEQLVAPWLNRLVEYGFAIEPAESRAAHLFGVRFPTPTPLTSVARRLAERGVAVSVRGEVLRVAPHVYNDEGDLAVFYEELCRLRHGVGTAPVRS